MPNRTSELENGEWQKWSNHIRTHTLSIWADSRKSSHVSSGTRTVVWLATSRNSTCKKARPCHPARPGQGRHRPPTPKLPARSGNVPIAGRSVISRPTRSELLTPFEAIGIGVWGFGVSAWRADIFHQTLSHAERRHEGGRSALSGRVCRSDTLLTGLTRGRVDMAEDAFGVTLMGDGYF